MLDINTGVIDGTHRPWDHFQPLGVLASIINVTSWRGHPSTGQSLCLVDNPSTASTPSSDRCPSPGRGCTTWMKIAGGRHNTPFRRQTRNPREAKQEIRTATIKSKDHVSQENSAKYKVIGRPTRLVNDNMTVQKQFGVPMGQAAKLPSGCGGHPPALQEPSRHGRGLRQTRSPRYIEEYIPIPILLHYYHDIIYILSLYMWI